MADVPAGRQPDGMALVNVLARAVQEHAPVQPWSRHGESPVPVQIWYDASSDYRPPQWTVRFVTSVRSGKRRWATAYGRTIVDAFRAARTIQNRD